MDDRWRRMVWIAGGGLIPAGLAAALIPARDWLGASNVALLLMLVVVAISMSGNRVAASVAALSGALAFDLFHTIPYGSFSIANRVDITTFVCLMMGGLAVTQLTAWGLGHRTTAERSISDVAILRSIAELTSSDEDPAYVLMTAAYWLRVLLDLRDCRYERDLSPTKAAELTTSGEITIGEVRWDTESAGMPHLDINLVICNKGRPVARFVMTPEPFTRVPPDRLLTAAAIADQVGLALAVRHGRLERSS